MYYTTITTEFCKIIVVGDRFCVRRLHLDTGVGKRDFTIEDNWLKDDKMLSEARVQIEEYCRGNRTQFTITVEPEGTEFQKKVWQELCNIPFGEVRTYKQVAHAIGNNKGARAVGAANSKNPIPLIIPCHRVIGADGSLTGFAHGVGIKQRLIAFEQQQTAGA